MVENLRKIEALLAALEKVNRGPMSYQAAEAVDIIQDILKEMTAALRDLRLRSLF